MDITVVIPADSIVHIGDVPVLLKADALVSLSAANVPLVAQHLEDRLPRSTGTVQSSVAPVAD